MADAVDPAELLGIDADQLTGMSLLVAHHRRRRIERLEAAETQPAQDGADRRTRQAEVAGDLRPGQALPASILRSRQSLSPAGDGDSGR
jgi:hypothetical protein